MQATVMCSNSNTTQSQIRRVPKVPLTLIFVVPLLFVSAMVSSSTNCAGAYNDCMDIASDAASSCNSTATTEMKRNIGNCKSFYDAEIAGGSDESGAKQRLQACATQAVNKGSAKLGTCQSDFLSSKADCDQKLNSCQGA